MSAPFVGKNVVVIGTSRDELNGSLGVCVCWKNEKGRYDVDLTDKNGVRKTLALKPNNLELSNNQEDESGSANGFGGMGGLGAMLAMLQKNLGIQPGASPQAMFAKVKEQALAGIQGVGKVEMGVVLAVVVGLYFLAGIKGALVVVALLGLLYSLFGASFKAAGGGIPGVKAVGGEIGRKVSQEIMTRTGYQLDETRSLAAVVLVTVAGLYYFLRPSSPSRAPRVSSFDDDDDLDLDDDSVGGGTSFLTAEMQKMYNLGWQDSQDGVSHGQSLSGYSAQRSNGGGRRSANMDYEDYGSPASSSGGGGFGVGQMVTLVMLGKMVYDLGGGGAGWNPQTFIMNVKNLPPMRMVIMGMLIARLVGLSPI